MKKNLYYLSLCLLSAMTLFTTVSCGGDDDDTAPGTTNTNVPNDQDYGTLGKGDFTATGGFKNLKPFAATILCSINTTYAGAYMGMGVEIVPKVADFSSSKCQRVSGSGVTGGKYEVYLMEGDRGMLEANTTYYYRSYANLAGVIYYGATRSLTTPEPTIITSGAVDLGLSCKWATCNLGATAPEGAGDLYPFYNYNGPSEAYEDVLNKECNCSKHIYEETESGKSAWRVPTSYNYSWSGDADWDIVTRQLGGKWRTPYPHELRELCENCHWTPMRYKGVQGYAVSNGDGTKSIFIGCHTPKGSTKKIYVVHNTNETGWIEWKNDNPWTSSNYTYYLSASSKVIDLINIQKRLAEAYYKGDGSMGNSAQVDLERFKYPTLQLSTSGNLDECTVDDYDIRRWMFPVRPVCDK